MLLHGLRTDLATRYKVVSWSIVLDPASKRMVSGSDGTADDHSWHHDRNDTMWEVYEDQISESPKGSVVVSRTSKSSGDHVR
jgi:hypothetical protein